MTPARCASCGERVLERRVGPYRVILTTEPLTGERHDCDKGPSEILMDLVECAHCPLPVFRTSFGRFVRWVYPFPAPPYDEHYCAAPSQTANPGLAHARATDTKVAADLSEQPKTPGKLRTLDADA